MTTTIALAGKGGVGKTTVAGMIIKYLAKRKTKAKCTACQKMPLNTQVALQVASAGRPPSGFPYKKNLLVKWFFDTPAPTRSATS